MSDPIVSRLRHVFAVFHNDVLSIKLINSYMVAADFGSRISHEFLSK